MYTCIYIHIYIERERYNSSSNNHNTGPPMSPTLPIATLRSRVLTMRLEPPTQLEPQIASFEKCKIN